MHDFSIGGAAQEMYFLPVRAVFEGIGAVGSGEGQRKHPASGGAHNKVPVCRNVDRNTFIRGKRYQFRPLGQN